jgi:hypothetical protein
VKLKNAGSFKRSVSNDNFDCDAVEGIVTYQGKSSQMKVRPENLSKGSGRGQKEGFDKLTKLYVTSFPTLTEASSNNIIFYNGAFHTECGGFASFAMRELKGIQVRNTNKSKVLLAFTGQSAQLNLTLYIFARRGNSDILIEKHALQENGLSQDQINSYYEECDRGEYGNNEYDKCVSSKLLSQKNIDFATSEAKRLINDYALE